ncbi:hypothetical protein LJR066_002694 [Acidovorax sp. LjRoot66]|uniref:hypothetical protein n=1 Tax=Acidovorax sp. LjRoot66 TaxID=3342334 RepID=UPI003ECEF8F0
MPTSISCTETARPTRPALAADVEVAKFTVGSTNCSGSRSVHTCWTEVPNAEQADAIARHPISVHFDNAHAVPSSACARRGHEMVRVGANGFVVFHRTPTLFLLAKASAPVAHACGLAPGRGGTHPFGHRADLGKHSIRVQQPHG